MSQISYRTSKRIFDRLCDLVRYNFDDDVASEFRTNFQTLALYEADHYTSWIEEQKSIPEDRLVYCEQLNLSLTATIMALRKRENLPQNPIFFALSDNHTINQAYVGALVYDREQILRLITGQTEFLERNVMIYNNDYFRSGAEVIEKERWEARRILVNIELYLNQLSTEEADFALDLPQFITYLHSNCSQRKRLSTFRRTSHLSLVRS